jgi:hypothetical protein
MKNKLVVIGFMGSMQCYLNVPREEAIQRFCKENQYLDVCVAEFEFDDQFRMMFTSMTVNHLNSLVLKI